VEIVIPYCGAPNGEAIAHDMKKHHRDIVLIGTDSDPNCDNRWLYDRFWTVPRSNDPSYRSVVEHLLKHVDWILPLNGYDAVELMKSRLKEKVLATSNWKEMLRAMDKAKLYDLLGIDYVNTDVSDLVSEVRRYISRYGRAVVKLRGGRGSRGVFIVGELDDMKNRLHQKPGTLDMSFDVFQTMVETTMARDNFIVMPYYRGDEYFVNALCESGRVRWLQTIRILKKRDHVASFFEVIKNDPVEEKTKSICEAFGFDYWINLQFIGGHLVEVNPRISSWVAHPNYCVPYLAIRLAMGEDPAEYPPVRPGVVGRRIFQMYYIGGGIVY